MKPYGKSRLKVLLVVFLQQGRTLQFTRVPLFIRKLPIHNPLTQHHSRLSPRIDLLSYGECGMQKPHV